MLLVKDQFIHYYLSTCTFHLTYHHFNSCTAQQLLVVQKMDYSAIHQIEWIFIRITNCTIHWIMFCLYGYSIIHLLNNWHLQ